MDIRGRILELRMDWTGQGSSAAADADAAAAAAAVDETGVWGM